MFCGKVRKKNKKVDRQLKENDRRAAQHQKGKRTIMVLRQRGGGCIMFAANSETSEVAVASARKLVRHPKSGTKGFIERRFRAQAGSARGRHQVRHRPGGVLPRPVRLRRP
jgi:hypothetical protein